MDRKYKVERAPINQRAATSTEKSTRGHNKACQGGLRQHSKVQENQLLNMDNTFLQNINIDEIEQKADDFICRSTKQPVVQGLPKINKWPSLSLSGSSRSTAARNSKPLKDTKSAGSNSFNGNLNKKLQTPKLQKTTSKCTKTEINTMNNEIMKFQLCIQKYLLSKQSHHTETTKLNQNDTELFDNTDDSLNFSKMIDASRNKNGETVIGVLAHLSSSELTPDRQQITVNLSHPTEVKAKSTSSKKLSQQKIEKQILSETSKKSSFNEKKSIYSANQIKETHKIPNDISSANVFDINASDFMDNDDFKSFLERNVGNAARLNKIGSNSQSLFSSGGSFDINCKIKRQQNPADSEQFSFPEISETRELVKNTNSQKKLRDSQTEFSQFFNCSQVVRQLEDVVLQQETSKDNSINDFANMNNNSASKIQPDNCSATTETVFKRPSNSSGKVNYKRKSLESVQGITKVPKINVPNAVAPSQKENELDTSVGTFLNNANLKDDNIEYRMTQLLKSSQYLNEVTQLFQNLEHSICQLGPNQNPIQQSKAKQVMENTDWPDDSFMTEAFLSGLTQNTEANSMGNLLKKALKENAAKSAEPRNLVNHTVINNEAPFQEMGAFYGLPNKVKELIKLYKGIDALYDWQDECLNLPAVKHRDNLIYSLPTSGGKTLVAEILILREIICRKRNAIFVLPYVAIVQEKVWALSPFAVALDFLVEEYAAGKGSYPPRKRRHKNCVYIATTEKALGIVNSLVEQGRLEEVGLVVVDELHLIGDEQRGPTLEALLTKLMYINDDIQIVGMSATIGNISDIQRFLKAEVYTRNFRPVELTEYIKCENQIAKINWNADADRLLEVVRTIDFHYSEDLAKIDPDRLGGLVMETVPLGSCLIFCPSKKSCENVTKLLCKVVFRTLKDYKAQEKRQLLNALKTEAGTLCPILQESTPYGIAYHHSGLTAEERRLIEESYRSGILCVICCTSTLAAGVNLPAKRVIIRKPYIAQDFINLSRYKQMIGRAGRAGLGEEGESIMICTREELKKAKELLLSPMDQVLSKMCNSERLRLLFLSCISLGTANTIVQLQQVTSMTLLAVQQEKLNVDMKKLIKTVISDLFNFNAVQIFEDSSTTNRSSETTTHLSVCFNSSVDLLSPMSNSSGLQKLPDKKPKKQLQITNTTKLVISKSGSAAIKGGLELHQAMMLYDDLQEAQESLVLVDCLHLLYLVTPYNLIAQIKPDRNQYYNIMMQLGKQERKTATMIGIKDAYVMRMLTNQCIKSLPERVLNRFYASLMLYDLWNEVSVFEVSEKYQVNRGIVQNLMTQAATFASNVVNFCEQFEEFWAFTHLLRGMSQRLGHCCCRELLPLMELPAVKQSRARQLFNAGFKNLQSIAKADPDDLIQAIEFMSRRLANQLIAASKMLLLEKVETLREEAEDILEGVENPKLIFNKTFHMK